MNNIEINDLQSHEDVSPFEVKKIYRYTETTEYNLKKAEQLYIVKNYEKSFREYSAMLRYAIKNKNFDLISSLENKKDNIKDKLILKNKSRKALKNGYHKLLEKKLKDYTLVEKLKKLLEKYLFTAKKLEEYNNLIQIIVNHNLEMSDKDELKKTIEIILTFSPLKYLLEAGKIEKEKRKIYFLFDLDSTLFDNSPRFYRIIREFIKEYKKEYPEETKKLSYLKRKDIVWGLKENLKKVNIDVNNEIFFETIFNFFVERFISNEYIIDVPLKNSLRFTQEVYNAGIKVLYLSGRQEKMREGTLRNIKKYNFPIDENSESLILKPDRKILDHDFKESVMQELKKFGDMFASFDNEPINVNIFQNHYPEANIFFLETNHSPDPPNILETIHTIPNFCY